jgi:hypothetical protein
MLLEHFSQWVEQATHPSYKYYFPVQCTLAAGEGYVGTLIFTKISPIRGMALSVLTFAISQLITPYFVDFFQPYSKIPLAPMAGQLLQMASSFSLALIICNIAGLALSLKKASRVCAAFIAADAISACGLYLYRIHRE